MAIVFWGVLIIICVIAEVHSNAFVAVFVGIGALPALVLAIAGVPIWVQTIVWVIVMTLGLVMLRPVALAHFNHRPELRLHEPGRTTMTGEHGVAETLIGGQSEGGRVKIRGESWKAIAEDEDIATGTEVEVSRVLGTTLWVRER